MSAKILSISSRRTKTKTKRRRRPRDRSRNLLDRARLTVEIPNYQAGRADLHERDRKGSFLTGHAPRNFLVWVTLERGDASLWIGIDTDPHNPNLEPAAQTCFAVITGNTLIEFAKDVLRCYPAERRGVRE